MDYEQVNFTGIENADGLNANESLMLSQLVAVFNDRLQGNKTRMEYYEDKVDYNSKNIGLSTPREIAARVDTSNGLAAIAVDYLANRSIFDSFTLDSGISEDLNDLLNENNFAIEYAKSVPSQLVCGVGFWTISKGGPGEPKAVINYHNAMSAAALWDFRKKRVKCGFVVEDYELVQYMGKEVYQPSYVVLHTDYAVIEIERNANGWAATRKPHMLGRPLIVAMANKPQDLKPLGRARVSRAVMSICNSYSREILRMELHSELFASGQKAILGVSESQYDALAANKYRAAVSELFIATPNYETGENPEILSFPQQAMTPHIDAMEMILARLSAETSIPIAAFGISDKGRTSSEALQASYGDLVIEAENLNRNNGKAILEVARLALAIATNRTLDQLTDDEKTLQVHWIDPAMPSAAAVADATVKLAGAVPEFGGTDIFWEMNGFNEEQRRRVKADMRSNATRAALNGLFKGNQAASGVE